MNKIKEIWDSYPPFLRTWAKLITLPFAIIGHLWGKAVFKE